jgi:hypothetical protein
MNPSTKQKVAPSSRPKEHSASNRLLDDDKNWEIEPSHQDFKIVQSFLIFNIADKQYFTGKKGRRSEAAVWCKLPRHPNWTNREDQDFPDG